MLLKQIKVALFILCISFIFMCFGFHQNLLHGYSMTRGNYFFEKTRINPSIQRIVLTSSEGQSVTFDNKNSFWRIREADGYYASFARINAFFDTLRNTVVFRSDKLQPDQYQNMKTNAFSIKTFDLNDNLIDDVLIVPKQSYSKFHYAFYNNSPILYQIDGFNDLSFYPVNWLQMPLLALTYKSIKSIKTNNFSVMRQVQSEELTTADNIYVSPQIHSFLDNLWYLSADDVLHSVHFDRKKYALVKNYEITTFDGLIYILDIYTDENDYWFNIKLALSPVVRNSASIFYKENHILYKGWFFKIDPHIAQNIVNFVL